jgi:Family of unknown function (DUF695)
MDAIGQFWSWWGEARPRIEAAIQTGAWGELTAEVADRVRAIEPRLDWEFGPGVGGARHALCLSGKGDPDLRRLTERWVRAGPPADATWEFHPARRASRPANLSLTLGIAGREVCLSHFLAAYRMDGARERLDASIFHPDFPNMEPELRMQCAFIVLDHALGEDGVERWIGAIDAPDEAPSGLEHLRDLLDAVDDLEASATGERFVSMQGESDGLPSLLLMNRALKRIDHPLCDMHVAVTLTLATANDLGLPDPGEAAALDAIEEELTSALDDAAVFAARETSRGRRTLHFFAPELGRAAGEIDAWAARHLQAHAIEVTWNRDPAWQAIAGWT